MVYYPQYVNVGTDAVSSLGDGTTINVKWFQAIPNDGYSIAYHIYYSTTKENVFSEGVKYISIDSGLEANLIDLVPGQEYFIAVRPVEYNPLISNLSALPVAYDNLRVYPSSLLRSDITSTDLTIPLLDVTGFPSTGVIKIGVELIYYLVVDTVNNNLILASTAQRGYANTTASLHTIGGWDGYKSWDPSVGIFTLTESKDFDRIFMCQTRYEYPNYSFTLVDGYKQVTKDILSTDLSAAEESNLGFPMYDYAGYHRTDPVQLLNGTCVGSYIGGEMGCIDGYGNVNMIRGLSLQDQNNQRQELLLSVTGRPAVLVKQVHTGIVCSCYLASGEYPDDRCPKCFVPGTLVNSKNGFIPIENIKAGDLVLGSDGEYHKVIKTHKNNYCGDLISISTTSTTNPILSTPDHPFLILGGTHGKLNKCGPNSNCIAYINRGDGRKSMSDIKQLPSGNWQARVSVTNHKRKYIGTFKSKELAQEAIYNYVSKHYLPGHTPVWKDAQDIKKQDWIITKSNRNIKDIDFIKIPQQFCKNTKLGSARNGNTIFKVDEDLLWIMGLYIAEGSAGKRSINFALHKKENNYANKIVNYFNINGFNSKITKCSNNGIRVDIYSTSLSLWFKELFGFKCYNKKIPNELMNLPENKSFALIRGIFDGDASKRDQELIQTSEILTLQISEILQRFGKKPIIRKIINKTKTVNGNDRKTAYGISYEKSSLNRNNRNNRKGRWQLNEHLLSKVKSLSKINYSGPVYNLEVEGDHTYVVQNLVVHNCHGTKFVYGYEQFFNPRRSDGRILVRMGPAEETTKMYEAGYESEFPLDLWTLSSPIIKQRDLIILFDQDNNEEFRYEVMGVSRNNTTLGQMGGQKLRVQRIRKTDPTYQVRVFRDTSTMPSKLNTSIGFTTGIPPHTHEIVRNETDPSNWSQTTSVSQGHNHPVVYKGGSLVVLTAVGHDHKIIIP